jgi:hypothetical protein
MSTNTIRGITYIMLNVFEFEKEEGKNWIAEIRKYGALEGNHKMRRIAVYIFNHLLLA